MKRYRCTLLLVLTSVLAPGACILLPAAAARTTAAAPSSAHLSDMELEHAIHAKLAKSKIGKDGFTVHVKGGVATWEGHTGVAQHKGSATRMARTAGVARVVNNIVIDDGAKLRRASIKTE